METNIKEINLKDYGESFGPRVLGINIKNDVIKYLNNSKDSKVIFNFSGIDIISTGFSKELFGGLWIYLGDDFNKRIRLKILENSEIIKSAIFLGIRSVRSAGHKFTIACPVSDNEEAVFSVKFISDGNKSSTKIRVPDIQKPVTIKDEGFGILGTGAVLRNFPLTSHTQAKNMIPEEDNIIIEFHINGKTVTYNKKKTEDPNPHIMIEMSFPKPDVE